MKKVFLLVFILFQFLSSNAETISGGVSVNNVDSGFFGNWIVRGEIKGEVPKGFKFSTSQIWNLRKENSVIILENKLSGARGNISVDKAFSTQKSAFLKFTNRDEKNLDGGIKIVLVETPEITLYENEFQGIDTFQIKKYKNGALYKEEVVKYEIVGRKIR